MPPVENVYDTSLADEAYALARDWHMSDIMGIGAQPPKAASADNLKGWSSEQVQFSYHPASCIRCINTSLTPFLRRVVGPLYDCL